MKQTYKIVILLFLVLAICKLSHCQFIKLENKVIVAGYVFNEDDSKPLSYTNIYIKQRREGTISDTVGYFIITAKITDTLTFSLMGFDKKYVIIDESAIDRNEPLIVYLKTKAFMLPTVDIYEWRYKQLRYELKTMQLTDDDIVYSNKNFPIKEKAVEFYNNAPQNSVGITFSPITALYEAFSKEGKAKRKLAEIKNTEYRDDLFESRIGMSNLMEITHLDRENANRFLIWCDFSADFIKSISEYELFQVINYKFNLYKREKNIENTYLIVE